MAHSRVYVLAAIFIVTLAILVSAGDGAVNFGYPNKCFFTVSKSASGAWWFVDPLNKPFLSLGVTSVSFWGDRSTTGATPYYDAVAAKFNNNQSAWADATVARLTSWNFNTLGAWGDTMVITKGMPYTRVLGFGSFQGALFPDVYDPAWEASTLEKAKAICEPLRNDPNLIGYYLDNEMMWGPKIQGWWSASFVGTLLDLMLTAYPKTAPGNIKAVNFLKGRYATISALNTAWSTNYANFSAINTRPATMTASYKNDSDTFVYMTAVQFFNISRNSIKKYDAQHLILGAKFVGAPSVPVLKACGEYSDVVSLDWYPYVDYPIADLPFFNQVYAAAKKPLLVGEFSYRGNDTGLLNQKGAGLVVKTQAQRAEGYKNFTTTLAALPYIVGLHWFQWADQPFEGRQLDGENSNYGVVNIHDDAYPVLTNQMKLTNTQLAALHESKPTGLLGPKCLSTLLCLNKCSGRGCCDGNVGTCKCDTGFSGVDCSVDRSKLQIDSFGTAVDTSAWSINNGGGWSSQTFNKTQTTTSANQLKLAISPCVPTTTCAGYNFTSSGAMQTTTYGFGTYSAQIKAPLNAGFTLNFELNSKTDPKDSITIHINGNQVSASLGYYVGNKNVYLKAVNLPANPSAAFHNYSISYMPTYFAFYIDNVLLGYYNSTLAPSGLPSRPMAMWFYVTALPSSPKVNDAAYVKAAAYQLMGGIKATCPASASSNTGDSDRSAASRSASWLPSSLASLFARD